MDAILFVSGKKTYSYEPGEGFLATQCFRDCSGDEPVQHLRAGEQHRVREDAQRRRPVFDRDAHQAMVLA